MNSHQLGLTRRAFLSQAGIGLGSIAAGALLSGADGGVGAKPTIGRSGLPHFAPTAKRVIYMFQSGGPSHIDLFNHSQVTEKLHGTELPDSIRQGQRLTGMTSEQKQFLVCAPISPVKKRESGAWISDLLPRIAGISDKISIINSMHTEAINHDPAITFINTGSQIPGRPSLGAWTSYGLGSLNANMPAYMVLVSQGNGKKPGQPIFSRLWGSGFLPSSHQGVTIGSSGGDPLLYLNDPKGMPRSTRREMLDDLAVLNKDTFARFGDPEIETRISQYEMAFRMQTAAPEIVDLSNEPDSTFKLYGEEARKPGNYAYNCLLARRLAEKDVRFIQLFHRGWDQHVSLVPHLTAQCKDTDQASAALVLDLEQRGLLKDTLIIWGGEFGRTAYSQGGMKEGRDHHGRCFSLWMAGGGIKRGHVHGTTDDFCYNIATDPVHIHDLNATILHCLGIDHERFTFKFQGLNATLTGVEKAQVVKGVLA